MRWLPLLILAACGGPPQPIVLEWTVTGRVLDAHGQPVPGAEVIAVVVDIDDEPPAQRQGRSIRMPTDAQGRFRIDPGADDERTFLLVRHEGRALSEPVSMADVAAQGRRVDLRIGPEPVPVTVVVHGTQGRVFWQTGSPGQGGSMPVADEVTLSEVPPGEVQIGFESRSGHWEVREVVSAPGLRLHFRKKTPLPTRGVVVDAAGKPIRGAYVHDSRMPNKPSITDARGEFAIVGAPLEEHGSFEAVAPGYARTIVAAKRDVRIVLVRSVAFKGRVTDSGGRPLIRARVVLLSMETTPWVTETIEQGHFFFDHGRPKEEGSEIFGIEISAPGYATHTTGPLPIDEPGVVDLKTIALEKLE